MKITKKQLVKIIAEESSRLLSEDKDQNKDGKNDFEDVKIARMKASGMSDEEIKKKHPDLFESENPHPKQYGAPQGSERDKGLDKTKEDLASGDPERIARAYRRRERMEKKERSKKGFKNKPRSDTKKESHHMRMTEADLREVIRNLLSEELSAKTKATLKKKAEKSYYNLTEDSRDDTRFKFKFDIGLKQPEYGYNYPYDYFTMLELIQVEANAEKEIDPLQQYRKATGEES